MTARRRRPVFRLAALAAAVCLVTWAGAQSAGTAPSRPLAPVGEAAESGAVQLPGVAKGVSNPLQGTWFRLKVQAKGFRVDNLSLEVSPASWKTTAYMLLLDAEGGGPGHDFDYLMWVETAPGVWEQTFDDDFRTDGANSELSVDTFLGFAMGGYGVGALHSGTLKLKLDKQGALKNATFKTLSGVLVDSALPSLPGVGDGVTVDHFWGRMKVLGKRTTLDKLPFNVF